ncbi:MAG: DUF126 domain-containing protein [Oscillospiraceae bacterium]|nr:DUF126 domain-containing protein [Oscillospiraceae bacterium]
MHMKTFTLKGRGVLPGIAEGTAIVFPDSIAGNSGALGDTDGIVYEKGNVNYGMCIKNAILVVPCAKGSNGFSAHFKSAYIAGIRPAGWVATRMDGRLGVAVASMSIPTVSDFKTVDPVKLIKTGDFVRIDGATGEVTVTRQID